MQRALFPMRHMRITQGYGTGTHRDSYAIDNAGKDGSVEGVFAPFDGVIRKIYTADANEVWLESLAPVQYADGTEAYMTVLFVHDNDVSDLKVGQTISQGAVFYQEGTKGQATGNHVHIECGKGKFEGTGWHKNSAGYWSIDNGKKPEDCLWLGSDVEVLDDGGVKWKKTSTPTKPETNKKIGTVTIAPGTWNIRTGAGTIYPVTGYAKEGEQYDYFGTVDGWYKLKNGFISPKSVVSAYDSLLVGDKVKIIGKYSASSTSAAGFTAAIGAERYITKVYKGRTCPYQLGVKKGDTSGGNTTGFAPSSSIQKL